MSDLNHSNRSGGSSPLGQLENRLKEAYEELWGSFVDPRDAMFDGDGSAWLPVGCEGLD